jgi:DNA-binding transcriptional ArsR family regulator
MDELHDSRLPVLFEVLGSEVRRSILELLAEGDLTAGAITAAIVEAYLITQPAVSRHLKVLRDAGLVVVRSEGSRRRYAIDLAQVRVAEGWLRRLGLRPARGAADPGSHVVVDAEPT